MSKISNKTEGGRLYALWLLILPLLLGFACGRGASLGLGFLLDFMSNNAGMTDAAVTQTQENAEASNIARGLEDFLASNPFKITPQHVDTPAAPVVEQPKEEPKPVDPGLDNLVVRGTLPGVGAWVENSGKLTLLLVGKDIERYKLTSVLYNAAVFRKGKAMVTKYIVYGPLTTAKAPEAPKPAPAPVAQTPEPQNSEIVAAAPGGQEGQVSSETVNQLVQNPFDELKRVRLRPSDKSGGLEVQWIQNDSILKQLGVQKGDIIRSVNGIAFTNMGDIANSINSLMNSERFDVEVTRGGKMTALRYVVR